MLDSLSVDPLLQADAWSNATALVERGRFLAVVVEAVGERPAVSGRVDR
jgi:hypothetical protein